MLPAWSALRKKMKISIKNLFSKCVRIWSYLPKKSLIGKILRYYTRIYVQVRVSKEHVTVPVDYND